MEIKGMTFYEFKSKCSIDRHVNEKFKKKYNEFLDGLLPTVLLEEGIKETVNTVKLSEETWQKFCERIFALFVQTPMEET
ncbi:MAG: hypothetical protein KAU07_01345 [Candidatus Andersenbacteria bacterium]|nr:hypothetical protein [Candidatus Andersenbacteria bacterium]